MPVSPHIQVTTKITGDAYGYVPVPVSCVVYSDSVLVGNTDPNTGVLVFTVSDESTHEISVYNSVTNKMASTPVFGVYGSTTVVQDFVFSVFSTDASTQVVVTSPLVVVATPYTGMLSMYPLFGNESDAYMRLLYGSASTTGMPKGLFWDFRAPVVPYSPFDATSFRVIVDPSGVNTGFRLVITRENPTEIPTTSTIDFVPNAIESVLDVFLGRGQNTLYVYSLSSTATSPLFVYSVVATNYGTILHAYASAITDFVHTPLNDLKTDVYSNTSVRALLPLLGFLEHVPDSRNLSRSALQRIVNVLVNQPGSTLAVSTFIGSLFAQTPVLAKPTVSGNLGLNALWLRPMVTSSQIHNGVEAHVWQLDPELARWYAYPKLLSNTGDLLAHGLGATVSTTQDVAEWNSTTRTYNAEPPMQDLLWWDFIMESFITYDSFPHKRRGTNITNPLWDTLQSPLFDSNVHFDTYMFDIDAVSGDIVFDGFIGTSVTGEASFSALPGVGVGVLDRTVETTVITSSYSVVELEIS